jgi:hypothetical protein
VIRVLVERLVYEGRPIGVLGFRECQESKKYIGSKGGLKISKAKFEQVLAVD